MKKQLYSQIFTVSLTIFAMLFGAGNLIFPLRIGMNAGEHTFLGFLGFATTGVLLPVLGLLAIVAFEGNYTTYFNRLGRHAGTAVIFLSMLIIGPLIAMPRIITLSYEMMRPFIPYMDLVPSAYQSGLFAIFFCSLVFLVTYQPSRLLQIIGKVLSPLKVISIVSIVLLGVFSGLTPSISHVSASEVFVTGFNRGYETLDLLGAIFFGSIIVTLLTQYVPKGRRLSTKEAVTVAGYSSVFAAILLAGVYAGMTYLGAFHGHGLDHLNEGQIFSAISFRVLGHYGAALIGCTVFLACFTTTVSVTAVVADYIKRTLSRDTLPYAASVTVVLVLATLTASFGLGPIIAYSKPFILFFYPIFIVITFCNILYTLFDFPYIKLPVAVTAVALLVKSLIAAM